MKHLKNWLFLLLATILLVACSNSENDKKSNDKNATDGSYTVVDDRGKEITFDKVPEKIISLQPSNTEILFELGEGDKIIGATEYDLYPEEAKKIERVSDSVKTNNERIIELNPDVVFAYTIGGEEQMEQLENAGIKVFVIKAASSIEDIYGDINQIAEVMGIKEKGEEVVQNMKTKLASIQEKTSKLKEKKKVYFEISPAPDIWSMGSGTYQQELIEIAGVENLYKDQQGWFSVTEEDIINRNPDAIITTVNYVEDPKAEILSRPGWDAITAVKNKEVYLLNGDILDRPGPRIAQAAELIAKSVYPELFKD